MKKLITVCMALGALLASSATSLANGIGPSQGNKR